MRPGHRTGPERISAAREQSEQSKSSILQAENVRLTRQNTRLRNQVQQLRDALKEQSIAEPLERVDSEVQCDLPFASHVKATSTLLQTIRKQPKLGAADGAEPSDNPSEPVVHMPPSRHIELTRPQIAEWEEYGGAELDPVLESGAIALIDAE